jgi:uncharacterized protein YacL
LNDKVFRLAATGFGAFTGLGLYAAISEIEPIAGFIDENLSVLNSVSLYSFFAIIFSLLFFSLYPGFIHIFHKSMTKTEKALSKVPASNIIAGSIGLLVGLLISYFISNIYNFIPVPFAGVVLSVITYIFFAVLGVRVAIRNFSDLTKFSELFRRSSKEKQDHNAHNHRFTGKILDTSVIIDGRIADLCKTGFIEGTIIIPEFILEELRHIADSSDNLKRAKGRRGLDILNIIQKEIDLEVKVVSNNYDDIDEVDMKLLKLAKDLVCSVLTNDYNLNKVALIQGVKVLNINELSNAVKPNALPGEIMYVTILKEGKENDQGVAYLDDGTMIVVEGARKKIGESMTVMVTSVLQTAAGRMIFAKQV